MDVTLGDGWLKLSEPQFPSLPKGGEDLSTIVFGRTEVETPITVPHASLVKKDFSFFEFTG